MSATACASNGGNATASAYGEAQATAVAQAAAVSYAAAFASLQSCTAAPPPSGRVGSRQNLQCILLPNTNLDGDFVQSTTAPNAGGCCDLCKANRWVGGSVA